MIDAQQILAFAIVALAAALLVRGAIVRHRRAASNACGHDCGCESSALLKAIPPDRLQELRAQRKRMNGERN